MKMLFPSPLREYRISMHHQIVFCITTSGDDQWLTLDQDQVTLQSIPNSSFSAIQADRFGAGWFEMQWLGMQMKDMPSKKLLKQA